MGVLILVVGAHLTSVLQRKISWNVMILVKTLITMRCVRNIQLKTLTQERMEKRRGGKEKEKEKENCFLQTGEEHKRLHYQLLLVPTGEEQKRLHYQLLLVPTGEEQKRLYYQLLLVPTGG